MGKRLTRGSSDDNSTQRTSAILRLWARSGSARESVRWDPWRERWVVSVQEPAQGGKANAAILETLAQAIGVPPSALSLTHGATSPSKVVEVRGLDQETAEGRLRGFPA